jgi:hypothetical protein
VDGTPYDLNLLIVYIIIIIIIIGRHMVTKEYHQEKNLTDYID